MSKFSINFENEEQYKNFIKSIKDDVLKDIANKPYIPSNWTSIRKQMEDRFRTNDYEFSSGCGWWHTQMQALYAVFRLSFQKSNVRHLDDVEIDRLQGLHDELFELIEKYRRGNE